MLNKSNLSNINIVGLFQGEWFLTATWKTSRQYCSNIYIHCADHDCIICMPIGLSSFITDGMDRDKYWYSVGMLVKQNYSSQVNAIMNVLEQQ